VAEYAQYLVPISLLGIVFIVKLSLDQTVTLPSFLKSLIGLPVEIAFLTASFFAALTLKSQSNQVLGFTCFTIFLFIALLIVLLWRKALHRYEMTHFWWMFFISLINFAISITGLLYSINLLIGDKK
jgi:hypothetical protein